MQVRNIVAALGMTAMLAAACTPAPGGTPEPPPEIPGNPDAEFQFPYGIIRFGAGERVSVVDTSQVGDQYFTVGTTADGGFLKWWWRTTGTNGAASGAVQTTAFPIPGGSPNATEPTPDGGHLIVGHGNESAVIVKTNALGIIDTAFGDNGIVTLDPAPGFDAATDVLVQPDGKILVGLMLDHRYSLTINYGNPWTVEEMIGPLPHLGVARLLPDGTLDPTFGAGGLWEAPPPPDSEVPWQNTKAVNRTSLLLGADGSIIAAGAASRNLDFVKITSAGATDTSWGTNGFQRVLADQVYPIIPPGFSGTGVSQIFSSRIYERPGGALFASFGEQGWTGSKGDTIALTATGDLDTSFAGDGILDERRFSDISPLPDGSFTAIVGSTISKYTASGVLDTTFDGDGHLPVRAVWPAGGGDTPPTFAGNRHFPTAAGDYVVAGTRTDTTRTLFGTYSYNYTTVIARIFGP